ncbi:MAG: hypothetical protein COA32_16545 [Fluviicola sp.]|nr:MAG: hypothetical protein COA32_16545 [Fluviicola sp.]
MKNLIIPFLLLFTQISLNAQMGWLCNFDNSCGEQLQDTVSNPNNIWEVGVPDKTVFDTAQSNPWSMITDLYAPYPVNDTSYFIFKYASAGGYEYEHTAFVSGYYWVNSDSLQDYGTMELSLDQGNTWVDMLNDTAYTSDNHWEMGGKPVLTGNSNGWKYFRYSSRYLAQYFNVGYGDTVIYRFGFISDGQSDTLDGLMFDSFQAEDWVEDLPQYSMGQFRSKVYPNPALNEVNISFNNPQSKASSCVILDSFGQIVVDSISTTTEELHIDLQGLSSGIYHYQITKDGEVSKGKLVVQ